MTRIEFDTHGSAAGVVLADRLTVDRASGRVLQDVSLALQRGQCLAVVGPNGAGKTTLMQAILGLLPIAGGQVRLDGTPLDRLERRDIARCIAYVPQGYEGFLGFRVRQVVESGRYVHRPAFGHWRADDVGAVDQAIEQCGLEPLLGRRLDALSGGERQKVWLAAALAQQSPALFLDEPTAALDPKHQGDLIRLLRRQRDSGKAILLICHDLNLPILLDCDVLALRDGQSVFAGPADALADLDVLRQVFETEFERLISPTDDRPRLQIRP